MAEQALGTSPPASSPLTSLPVQGTDHLQSSPENDQAKLKASGAQRAAPSAPSPSASSLPPAPAPVTAPSISASASSTKRRSEKKKKSKPPVASSTTPPLPGAPAEGRRDKGKTRKHHRGEEGDEHSDNEGQDDTEQDRASLVRRRSENDDHSAIVSPAPNPSLQKVSDLDPTKHTRRRSRSYDQKALTELISDHEKKGPSPSVAHKSPSDDEAASRPSHESAHVRAFSMDSHPSPSPQPMRALPLLVQRQLASSLKERKVRLNVGGQIFVTYASTLAKHPETLLGAMFHPRNSMLVSQGENEEHFFDRDPRVFEVILNFYRSGALISPPWLSLELLNEELKFWGIDISGDEERSVHRRLSMEMLNMEYKNKIFDAAVYKKMSRRKLLGDHHSTLIEVLEQIARKIERSAAEGHNEVKVVFFSPLHYSKATTIAIFNVVSKNEIRELIVELLKEKHFEVEEDNEYSKVKTTNIIGLDDQVTNFNDPKYFSFSIKW